MKTSELIGPTLDWAVAQCEGKIQFSHLASSKHYYAPSKNWAQGGPIIERERYDLSWLPKMQQWYAQRKQHSTDGFVTHIAFGPTILIAAMRCYVSSKLGDEIEIPEELQ